MGHKVKVRVTLNSGKTEKIGFTLEEGKIFRLNGEVPGMVILAALVGDPEATVVRMSLKNGALVVSRSSKGPELVVNGNTLEESKIKKGDILTYGNGKIEFLEAPVWVEEEPATKMISLSDSGDATSVMENPNRTKFINAPSPASSEAAEAADPVSAQATHSQEKTPVQGTLAVEKTPVGERPAADERVEPAQAAARTAENTSSYGRTPDGATGLIMAARGPDGKWRSTAQAAVTSAGYENEELDAKPLWQHVGISLAIIGVCGEIASLVGFGFKYPISPIATPYSGLFLMALFSAIAWGFFKSNPALGSTGKFQTYLRSFAWFSVYLLPFSCAFGFPTSVIVLASILLGAVWIAIFALKYFGHLPKFIPASVGAWVFLIVFGFHTLPKLQLQGVHAEGARDVASEAAPAPAVSPEASKIPAAMTSGEAVSPAQVATAPSAVTSPVGAVSGNQDLSQQAANLSLDPMAQERFFNAVKSGNLNMVESMVETRVIDPVFMLDHGSSALHYAASQGDLRMVKYLISKRVNIDAQDAGGTTPLMWAVYKQRAKVVEYLLKKKANPNIRREGGDRALELARAGDDKDILAMIRAAMKPAPTRRVASVKKKRHHQ